MSAFEAAGCALSRSHGVSVVPISQCRPHGMTNSTDFSVFVMKPASERIRSRGTTRCTPLEACTFIDPRPPTIAWISSVHTPAALTTTLARTSNSRSVSRSIARTPTTRSDSRMNPVTRVRVAIWAPYDAAVRATVLTQRASSTCAS